MLVANRTAYAIDKFIAGIMLIRRDVTMEDWSDPMADKYGLKATTSVWLRHTEKQRHSKNDQHKHYLIDQKEAF